MKFIVDAQLPRRLLISTGNLSNEALSKLVAANWTALESALARHDFVELTHSAITIHV
jgi:predicted nuclease of predicted toxin-antitoxin system